MLFPRILKISLPTLLLGLMATHPAFAQGYETGHGALQLFNEEGQAQMPQWVRTWLLILVGWFALGLIFVLRRTEARWAVGGFIAMAATAIVTTRFLGVQPLGGYFALLHLIFWSPALYVLLKNRPFMKERSLYAVWSGVMAAMIIFSFVFDIRDAAIYLGHVLGGGVVS